MEMGEMVITSVRCRISHTARTQQHSDLARAPGLMKI